MQEQDADGLPEAEEQLEEDNSHDLYLSQYRFIKTVPQHPHAQKHEIYLSRSSNFPSVFERAEKILDEHPEVVIHGLGAAISKATKIALALKEKRGDLVYISCSTSTVALHDEYEPLFEDAEPITQVRYNSAIHIAVRKTKQT